ncbi:carboxypeptidase regulatory-like domain-containing protein [Algoriphagus halophytocola]|uniref:Carboxypeptidase regulatory-like domain-containing protein n=1 Tax=Algoriphagus halophytocola TaxID=2991499 RepID=A0ABY6ME38_9BACT|nr:MULTISPECIES: carboxypeptidase regulatory-like domain-containing protein [unclassified Algoriphagus]UZD21843.1 carboxypeptidase regulatory-like domain-containing protein [Algoriphagus sp. TR-M5]WBL43057.1 carboxypeptidase regulatory-like domain-containing protein [Algoriphagus sp. TR-M9]
MRQSLLKSLMALILLITVGMGVSQAQVTTSSVVGQVVDSQGEPLPGANIVAMHEPSGTRYGAVSNLDGRYTIPNMRIGGPYTVQVSFIGFETVNYTGMVLKLGEPYTLNTTLSDDSTELGEVVITGSRTGELESNKTGTSTSISNKQLTELPQINRSITEFTRLTPQANGTSFAGRDARYNNLQVDGANFNNGFGLSSNPLPGGNSQPISLDAIEQISVNIAPFDVTQSGFTGAGINAVTRSGTNTFTGSAYYFTKNQDLQGNKIGDSELEKVDAATKNFGFRLGGPIIKNKLFFFVNAEREVNTGANASGANLWRASTDGVSDPDNNIARTSVDDLEAVRNHLINVWDYDPGRYQGYANEAEQASTKFLARIDWNISDKHKLAVRYNQVVGTSPQTTNGTSGPRPRTPFPAGQRVGPNSISFENANYGFENTVRSLTAELNSYFSPSVSNQFIATYSKIQDTRTTPSDVLFPFVDIWDGQGMVDDGEGNMVKDFGSMNYMSFGTELFSFNNDVVNDNFSFINNLTYINGQHTITAGAAFELQKFGNSYVRLGTSYYRYASVEDFLTTGTANEVAPTMFGLTYPYEGQETYSRVNFGLASLYAQDKYAVNEKLTLTLGLRAELPMYLNDLTANPSINEITLLDSDYNPKNYDSGSWPKSRVMLSPRFGFNYDVMGDRSLILRGGTGVFSGRVPFVWLTNMPTNAGVLQNNVEPQSYEQVEGWIGNVTFQPEQYYYLNNPPAGAEDVFIKSPEEGAPSSFALVDDEFKMPMVWRSSLGADYQIGDSPFMLTADLLYTRDINGVFQFGANRDISPDRMNSNGDDREVVLPGNSVAYNPVMGANNATILTNTNVKGHAFSSTLGVSVLETAGLSGSIFYTYSAAKEVSSNSGSNASSAWGASPNINSPNDQRLHISDFALPHRLVANMSYRVEYGNHFATTLGVYYTGGSQGRFSYSYGNDLNGDGVNADLIYLPANSAEINFVDIEDDGVVQFTAEQQRTAFDQYVANNDLEQYRGDYIPRNGLVMPWLSRFDIRVLQDVFTNIGERRNTLQLSLDIVNFGNLLNKDWGIQQTLNGAQNLLERASAVSADPNFQMTTVSGQLPTSPFRNVTSYSTTWSMQFGLRYIF